MGEALSGDVRLLLVVGDAGIGKTRFVEEGMRRAAAAGMVSIWGACLPLAEKLPLLPVAEALGVLAKLDDGRVLSAGLEMTAPYVEVEVGRLVPQLESAGAGRSGRGAQWQRERLFSGVAELLAVVARRSELGVVIEDIHWADSETLDLLTVVAGHEGGVVKLVATCRSDEAPLDPQVSRWLAHVRAGSRVEEIRLPPLSRAEAAGQVAALAGGPVPAQFAGDVYTRAEGNPFFTEQLVAAALADSAAGGLIGPAGLPARLAELLIARAGRCGGDARVVLDAMAVAGRPLTEDLLGCITGLGHDAVRGAVRELAAARLLAETTADGEHQPRHALLAEAVATALLPAERVELHERAALALSGTGDQALAAEAAGHWQAADRPAEELPARVAAAQAAERVFGYAEAARHWQRAIELGEVLPGAAEAAGIDLPRMFVRATDALQMSGAGQRAGELAEEAYRRYAGHHDPGTAAVIHARAAYFRAIEAPDTGLPLMTEALRLFAQTPPSADHAEALLDYAVIFMFHAAGQQQARTIALRKALEIAEAADAAVMIPQILSALSHHAFVDGRAEEGLALLR